MKKTPSNTIGSVARVLFWLVVLVGSIIILFWLILRLSEKPLISSPQSSTETLPTTNSVSDFYFAENFDDGSVDGFTNKTGLWIVTKDENDNNILEVNSMNTPEYPGIEFGKADWKNFIFQVRIRIVDYVGDAPLASLRFRDKYVVAFTPFYGSVDLVYEPSWKVLAGRTLAITKNKWYSMRIETKDTQVKVFLDDSLIINENVTYNASGALGFSGWPNVILQFDDVVVSPNY
jgi:hypothetical protein